MVLAMIMKTRNLFFIFFCILLSGCSTEHIIKIINFKNLNMDLNSAQIEVHFKNKRIITDRIVNAIKKDLKNTYIQIRFANANIPIKIILKDNSKNYKIFFIKANSEGLLYKLNNNLYFVAFSDGIMNLNHYNQDISGPRSERGQVDYTPR